MGDRFYTADDGFLYCGVCQKRPDFCTCPDDAAPEREFDDATGYVYLVTTGTGQDGDEWYVESIHQSKPGADRARREYQKPRTRPDGSQYSSDARVERWKLRK